ncbi:MAG: glucuronate isomerase [Acidobacteria bacterium]|nr:glucuronate isomerase [Acidobacteriota bacterium]
MHPDRFFDPEPGVRAVARALYEETRALPLICPHGHVDPAILADDRPFPEPTSLVILPDHYILRMLYSQGIALDALGVARRDGSVEAVDPRATWATLGAAYHLFRGTPTAAWLDYQIAEVFGVDRPLGPDTALYVYDAIAERLRSPAFRPRRLFERFNVEVLATTDAAADTLDHHRRIRESGWPGRVIPTYRPDALLKIASPGWPHELERLARVSGRRIVDYAGFVDALVDRRRAFRSLGATATDHAVEAPRTGWLERDDADRLFRCACDGRAALDDERRFEAHMLMEMARASVDDGLVMQLHPGSLRNHDAALFERFGADRGGDIPIATEFTRNLMPLLNAFGNDPRFRLILFTLDEATYSRELAPLAGHYPAVRLGPPWWFHDSIEGMIRFRRQTTETAGIYNTAGFNDDTRSFCSIPARHDLARRVDANWLAGLVARHVVSQDDAREMARALAYDLAKDAYRLKDC